jgi:uncharacterized protein YeaO (DUF488 family)
MIKCKSIYAPPSADDGERIFVDRLWPEGLSTRAAAIQGWLQELAPSYELWRFQFSPENWQSYRRLYWEELSDQALRPLLKQLKEKSQSHMLTLLYGTDHAVFNNAVALKEYLEKFNKVS